MFLSVEWAKRWLPAVFLLLSLFLPWWMYIIQPVGPVERFSTALPTSFDMSFPWSNHVWAFSDYSHAQLGCSIEVSQIPSLFLGSALIVIAGISGLTDKSRTRTAGGLLGIVGVISFLLFVLHKSTRYWPKEWNPYFGIDTWGNNLHIWFLSFGFYLALAGSLMLLLPLIRALIERLRKRL